MAITGVSSISGEQIIAAGALSARSAATALYDENGNAITSYLTAVPEGYATTGDLNDLVTSISETYQPTAGMTAYQSAGDYYSANNPSGFISEVPDTYLQNTDLTITDGKISEISGVPLSAGSTPAYGYTDNYLISSIDTSGLYATSAGTANHANSADALNKNGTMGGNIVQSSGSNSFYYMPTTSPFGQPQGIYSPLQYATGACLAMTGGSFGAYYKGNEWYVCNTGIGQALRGEVHQSRGVHISGATTAGYGFNLGFMSVSGVNSLGSWKYGHAEDAALRAVSGINSADFYTTANESGFITTADITGKQDALTFAYDSNDNISAINGSALAGEGGGSNVTTANTGNDYNINVNGLDVYGTVTTKSKPIYEFMLGASYDDTRLPSTGDRISRNSYGLCKNVEFTLSAIDPGAFSTDELTLGVILSGTAYDNNELVDYSALIGNMYMNRLNGPIPQVDGPMTVSSIIDLPSAFNDNNYQSNLFIKFSGLQYDTDGEWSVRIGTYIETASNSQSGIFIPNLMNFNIDENGQAYKSVSAAPITGFATQYDSKSAYFDSKDISSNVKYIINNAPEVVNQISLNYYASLDAPGVFYSNAVTGNNWFVIPDNIPDTGYIQVRVSDIYYNDLDPVILLKPNTEIPYALKTDISGYTVNTANTGNDYNISIDNLNVYGTVTTNEVPIYDLVTSYVDIHNYQLNSSTGFNMSYSDLAQSNMAKFTINDYEPSQIYYDGDILSFDVIFSGVVYTGNWPDYGEINFSSNIGNVTIDKTNPTIPPITITGKIEYPDEVLTAEGTTEFKIIYSSDKEFHADGFDWNFYVGSGEITGTSAGPSGIYIPTLSSTIANTVPSNTGTYVLKCIDGVIQWVAES